MKRKITVYIPETWIRTIEVEAETIDEAKDLADAFLISPESAGVDYGIEFSETEVMEYWATSIDDEEWEKENLEQQQKAETK
jgi:hypothetical protein